MADGTNKKTYGKNYYFDKEKQDCLSIKWQTGLKEFYIYHNKVLVGKYENPREFLEWKEVEVESKGVLKLKFYSKLMDFEVKSGDYYLENSYIHSKKKLWTVFSIFTVFALLSLLVGVVFVFNSKPTETKFDLDHYSFTFLKVFLYEGASVFMFKKLNVVFYVLGVLTYLWTVLPGVYSIISSLMNTPLDKFNFYIIFTTLFSLGIIFAFIYIFIKYFSAVKDYNKYLTSPENN